MNNRFVVQLIVVVASVILGMIIYPWLRQKFICFIEKIYLQTRDDKHVEEKNIELKEDEIPSIIRKSKWVPGQRRTKAATDLETENPKEKEHTFAPESGEESALMDVEHPLEKEEISNENIDLDEEETDISADKDGGCASGASFEELMHTNRTIKDNQAPEEDKEKAGRVLYQNQKTEMFEKVVASSEETSNAIASLIDLHLSMRAEKLQNENEIIYPDNFKDFDVNSIF